jgi:2-methylcitrate dehydratase PrpD
MLKYGAWPGWISQLATTAALAAEGGFTADTSVLDGKWGYWQMVGSPFFKIDNLLKGLGEVWHVSKGEFKPYPCCRLNHAGIDGICNLIQQHGIKPGDIEEIVVKGDLMLQKPHRMQREIKGPLDIQFANIYIFGLAPYFGQKPSASWGTPEVYGRPEIKAMSEKVKIELHPQTDEIIAAKVKAGQKPGFRKTIVEIKAKGQRFVTEIEGPRGGPDNPLSESELLEKFRDNASYSAIKAEKTEKIIEAILNLEKLGNVRKLGDLLSIDTRNRKKSKIA